MHWQGGSCTLGYPQLEGPQGRLALLCLTRLTDLQERPSDQSWSPVQKGTWKLPTLPSPTQSSSGNKTPFPSSLLPFPNPQEESLETLLLVRRRAFYTQVGSSPYSSQGKVLVTELECSPHLLCYDGLTPITSHSSLPTHLEGEANVGLCRVCVGDHTKVKGECSKPPVGRAALPK